MWSTAWLGPWLLTLQISAEKHQYCIIGAGPAGIQLGHFLKHAQRDYVIFERQARAGSFFEHYPRHRKLISLNKRKVRENRSSDFAFRHDWNTLIDVREDSLRTTPVTDRSKELFPHASVLSEYLKDFAAEQEHHIRYRTEVLKVLPSSGDSRFELRLSEGQSCWCEELVLATGFFRPRTGAEKVDGSHLLLGYEDLPSSGESFEGQAVLVLGQGNAALETAQELQQYTSELHLLARGRPLPQGGTGVRLAYQTHYVGDIRAGRTTLLDTYLLKSLDTFDFDGLNGKERLAIIPCGGGRLCVWNVDVGDCMDQKCRKSHDKSGQNLSYWLPIGHFAVGTELHRQSLEIAARYPEDTELQVKDEGFWEEGNANLTYEQLETMGIDPEVFNVTYAELNINSSLLRRDLALATEVSFLRQRAGSHDNLRFPMDTVIRCFGWTFDASILDSSFQVNVTHNGKYPKITSSWKVEGVNGLYAAGTISHSLDFRKSAGGFIHGFRYTSRALFRLLEERNFAVPWPQQTWTIPLSCSLPGRSESKLQPSCDGTPEASMQPVVNHLMDRINSASGPYQMFEFLGDMLLFEANASQLHLRMLEEVPLLHFHERYKDTPRLTWVFRYHDNFHGPDVLGPKRVGASRAEEAHRSKFLHPHLAFFPANSATATMRHWLVEDVFTQWRGPDDELPVLRFLTRVAGNITGA